MKNHMQRFAAGMIALSLCFLLLEGCSRNSGQTAGIQENRDEDKGQTAKVQEEESGTAAEKESGSTDSTAQAEQALTRTVIFTDDLGSCGGKSPEGGGIDWEFCGCLAAGRGRSDCNGQ